MPTVMRSREISEWKPHGWTGSVGRNGLDNPQTCPKYFFLDLFLLANRHFSSLHVEILDICTVFSLHLLKTESMQ